MSRKISDEENQSFWQPAADYCDPRQPIARSKSHVVDLAEPEHENPPDKCTARPRFATVNHNSRDYRIGLQRVADQLGLDVEDLLAADREIYR